ncbi:DNA polymerase III subunit chi [Sneathiella chinensis]|uniref:DNA polymerase III subunit chi n=1 Tax=Sneathiella chinensis TaxID=349750 RepID=A0ABQ5U601_9PROT|nr:DNA polymerase III subunit chi [Sneathiella chinensis]GLQ07564.1 DNA polymerase III subunit chi [Sneathiella chinensis]
MTEVSFYHLQAEPLERALPRLLDKVNERGLRTFVRLRTEGLLTLLDEQLWTWSGPSFLPHGPNGDEQAAHYPVTLGLEGEKPANNPTVLVLLEDAAAADVADFDRCLYMFDGNDDALLQAARARWKSFKDEGVQVTYWQQGPEGWQKRA